MFTGIIEAVCIVKSATHSAGGMQLKIDLGKLAKDTKISDSIAVNGTCLTVTVLDSTIAGFDVSSETLSKSTLAKLTTSKQVNTERAMKPADRFGGHFVTGHIDGTAMVASIKRKGRFADIKFTADAFLLNQMIIKGSVAVDGVSLTVADMDKTGFTTALIPQTLKDTTLGKLNIGDAVNIETDIIIKTVKKQLENILPDQQGLTIEKLKDLGF